jgi:nitroreductase
MKLEEAMRTQRALRKLKPDAVPDELLLELIDLAIRAPSGSNAQGWEFVLVRDRERKAAIGRLNRPAVKLYLGLGRLFKKPDEKAQRLMAAVEWQAEHFAEIPVVLVPCLRGRPPLFPFLGMTSYFGSIYPAVQNYMLAARSHGLGTTLITLPLWNVGKLRRILELPRSVTPCCLVPTGYPYGSFGPTTRRPAEEVAHWDRWQGSR